jgi:hypothetical protein
MSDYFRLERPQKGVSGFHQIELKYWCWSGHCDASLWWFPHIMNLGSELCIEVNSWLRQCRGLSSALQYLRRRDNSVKIVSGRLLRNPLRFLTVKPSVLKCGRSPFYTTSLRNCKDHFDAFLHYMNDMVFLWILIKAGERLVTIRKRYWNYL